MSRFEGRKRHEREGETYETRAPGNLSLNFCADVSVAVQRNLACTLSASPSLQKQTPGWPTGQVSHFPTANNSQ